MIKKVFIAILVLTALLFTACGENTEVKDNYGILVDSEY